MPQRPPRFKPRERVRVVTSDPANAYVNGRTVRVMDYIHDTGDTWEYGVDLFPPLERSWVLPEEELRPLDER
jgi:hypothetical protein